MFILWAVLLGALVGWVASIAMRTSTNEGILMDIAPVCSEQCPWQRYWVTTRLWIVSWLARLALLLL